MLIGIDPVLDPDVLWTLRAMGHGDCLAIVDANFPASALARRMHRMDGCDAIRALSAICSVMPVDDFIDLAAFGMAQVDTSEPAPIATEFALALRGAGAPDRIGILSRHDFYDKARDCFAVVATGEHRLYGNIIITKGVIGNRGL